MEIKAYSLGANQVVQVNRGTLGITLYEGESAENGAYFPAKSMFINGWAAKKLRDVLIELLPPDQFPPEKEKEQPPNDGTTAQQ